MRSLRAAAAVAVCGLIVISSAAQGAEQQPAPAELLLRNPSPLRETGGVLVADANDITGGVGRILDNQQGYTCSATFPPDSTFSTKPRFHSLTVRVKRQGLRVRSRSGFVGRPTLKATSSPANRMLTAVTSPFAGGEMTCG